MNKLLKIVFVLFLTTLFLAQSHANNKAHQWVIGQDSQSIDDFISALNVSHSQDQLFPDGFMVYTAINDLRGLSVPVNHGAGLNHADRMIKKYPKMHIIQVGLYMRYMLKEIINGGLDQNIDTLGVWIKNSGKDIYLRIGYEFDNPENEYDPKLYIAAYKHIVNRLRGKQVLNVYYVWHSIAWSDKDWPAYDPLLWYPGDDYVDWIGISFFDNARDYERENIAHIAELKQKPLMIAESSPFKQHTIQEKKVWLEGLFQYATTHHVSFISYINVNWDNLPLFADKKWGDARLEHSSLLESFMKRIYDFKK